MPTQPHMGEAYTLHTRWKHGNENITALIELLKQKLLQRLRQEAHGLNKKKEEMDEGCVFILLCDLVGNPARPLVQCRLVVM